MSVFKEDVFVFGQDGNLVGVITDPPAERRDPRLPGIILLNAGLINRVGPNRLYVKIARALAEQGHVVMRFDFSGIGDSRPRAENVPHDHCVILDTMDAMTWLHWTTGVDRYILMGHCSGAWQSLLAASMVPYIVGVVAMNPEPGSDDWTEYDRQRAWSQFYRNYYMRGAIPSAGRWARFLTGKVDYVSIARNVLRDVVGGALATMVFRIKARWARMKASAAYMSTDEVPHVTSAVVAQTRELAAHDLPVLFVHPEAATGAEFLDTVLAQLTPELRSGLVRVERLPGADHMYTLLSTQEALIGVLKDAARSISQKAAQQNAAQPAADASVRR